MRTIYDLERQKVQIDDNYLTNRLASDNLKMSETRTRSDMNQRRSNFVRLAEARTNKAIKSVRAIGNLSNRSSYEFSEADVRDIVSALNKEIATLKSRFEHTSSGASQEFKLKP